MKFSLLAIFLALFTIHYSLFTTPTAHAHSSVTVVKMTPKAFIPNEVTVDQNSTIIFINQDEIPRWPASNIHPTHELYPEFDPKHEVKPGESWNFKPKKAGAWQFHDHLDPHIRGTITVTAESDEEVKSPAGQTFNISFNSLTDFFSSLLTKIRTFFTPLPKEAENPEAFKNLVSEKQFSALTALARSKGSEAAWKFITETFKGEAGNTGNIHDLAHLAGKLLYQDRGITGIGTCTPIFAFGCYHGLLDTAFRTSLADLPQAEKECEKIGAVNSGPYGSCIHGIGHGVASFHQTKSITEALADCDRLTNGQNFCYDGVFMEFTRSAQPSFYSKDKPFYPCDSLIEEYGQKYSLSCGRNQPTVFISHLGLTFADAAKLCGSNTLGDQFKSSCFDALGFMLASTQDVNKIISGCKTIKNTSFSGLCFKSAAGELIFQEAPGWPEKSRQICDAAPQNYRALCHDNNQKLIKEYGRQAFKNKREGQDENEYIRSQMRICYESGGADNCYKNVANIFSQQFDLKKTLALFAENEEHPEIYARCHEATHYLSRNEYQKMGSIPEVYAQCDSTCHGGCYHGVLEQYLKEKNLAGNALYTEFPKVCGKPEDFDKPLVFNECLHGMGHAAMFVTDIEVRQSLELCDTIGTQEGRERCYSGVFMENSSSSTNNDHPGRWVKEDDPFFPCNALPEKYSRLCWRYQSSHFALITDHDWGKTANLCLKVPEEYQSDCFRTIGTNQVGFTQDTNMMRQNCYLMPQKEFQQTCLAGVISSFAYRFVGETGRMENFCSSVRNEFQESCFRQVGTSVIDWSKDKEEAASYCNNIATPQFSSWCKSSVL
ncbi:cupredoxin domain-containing protein [Candidatus Microgenomates bacterium]|nr:cupredoxin domain-containing protein [Candidatus Microgenomates bacterium]